MDLEGRSCSPNEVLHQHLEPTTGYGLDNQGIWVLITVGSSIFTSPHNSDRLWGPLCLVLNGSWGLFLQEESDQNVKFITQLQLTPGSRKHGSIHSLSPYSCMVECLLSYAQTQFYLLHQHFLKENEKSTTNLWQNRQYHRHHSNRNLINMILQHYC